MIKKNSFIDNIIHLGFSKYTKKAIHIALTFDDNYVMPAGITLFSIIQNNANSYFHFHLIVDSISEENKNKFKQLIKENISISFYQINSNFKINNKTLNNRFPAISCARFIIPKILKEITNKVLYIDSDMICLNSLINLYELSLESNIIAAVIDSFEEVHHYAKTTLNFHKRIYFNSGMLLINIFEWEKNKITENCIELINNGFIYKYADQDVLNILLKDKVKFIENKYNTEIILSTENDEEKSLRKETVFVHYVSANKPWYKVFNSKIFNLYFTSSPWRTDKRPLTNKLSSLRKYSLCCFKSGKIFKALYYYTIYLKSKFRQGVHR